MGVNIEVLNALLRALNMTTVSAEQLAGWGAVADEGACEVEEGGVDMLVATPGFRRMNDQTLNKRTASHNMKALKMGLYLLEECNFTVHKIGRCVRAFGIFEEEDGLNFEKPGLVQKCLESAKLLISPKRLGDHLKSVEVEVRHRLPLHEFLGIAAVCVEKPEFGEGKVRVFWGLTGIGSEEEARGYLDREYEKEVEGQKKALGGPAGWKMTPNVSYSMGKLQLGTEADDLDVSGIPKMSFSLNDMGRASLSQELASLRAGTRVLYDPETVERTLGAMREASEKKGERERKAKERSAQKLMQTIQMTGISIATGGAGGTSGGKEGKRDKGSEGGDEGGEKGGAEEAEKEGEMGKTREKGGMTARWIPMLVASPPAGQQQQQNALCSGTLSFEAAGGSQGSSRVAREPASWSAPSARDVLPQSSSVSQLSHNPLRVVRAPPAPLRQGVGRRGAFAGASSEIGSGSGRGIERKRQPAGGWMTDRGERRGRGIGGASVLMSSFTRRALEKSNVEGTTLNDAAEMARARERGVWERSRVDGMKGEAGRGRGGGEGATAKPANFHGRPHSKRVFHVFADPNVTYGLARSSEEIDAEQQNTFIPNPEFLRECFFPLEMPAPPGWESRTSLFVGPEEQKKEMERRRRERRRERWILRKERERAEAMKERKEKEKEGKERDMCLDDVSEKEEKEEEKGKEKEEEKGKKGKKEEDSMAESESVWSSSESSWGSETEAEDESERSLATLSPSVIEEEAEHNSNNNGSNNNRKERERHKQKQKKKKGEGERAGDGGRRVPAYHVFHPPVSENPVSEGCARCQCISCRSGWCE
ncbi:uncharacterized protein MONOS_13849p2 [Monocercomonoides exilis]|uniref:uncharacterized protein n=1 Tax=Monocercomonoides exilis TaxID=2049356 RepID=UPI00355990ED|nr:hypothetical protein MONOS_13849p2 [Monocercomonoides exilis]